MRSVAKKSNDEIMEELKHIDEGFIQELNKIANNRIEYWDLRCGLLTGTILDFTDQKSKEISSYSVNESAIRTFLNGGWGFLVLKDLKRKTIKKGFNNAIKLARLTESMTKNKFKIKERDPLITDFKVSSKKKLEDISIEEKIKLVKDHEKTASEYSSDIKNTRTLYTDGQSNSLFLNTYGSLIHQEYSTLRIFNLVFAQKNGILQRAVNSVGGLGGFEIANTDKARNLSSKTAEEVVHLLDAKSPTGGKFTVIMDPKLTGNSHAIRA